MVVGVVLPCGSFVDGFLGGVLRPAALYESTLGTAAQREVAAQWGTVAHQSLPPLEPPPESLDPLSLLDKPESDDEESLEDEP